MERSIVVYFILHWLNKIGNGLGLFLLGFLLGSIENSVNDSTTLSPKRQRQPAMIFDYMHSISIFVIKALICLRLFENKPFYYYYYYF